MCVQQEYFSCFSTVELSYFGASNETLVYYYECRSTYVKDFMSHDVHNNYRFTNTCWLDGKGQ